MSLVWEEAGLHKCSSLEWFENFREASSRIEDKRKKNTLALLIDLFKSLEGLGSVRAPDKSVKYFTCFWQYYIKLQGREIVFSNF